MCSPKWQAGNNPARPCRDGCQVKTYVPGPGPSTGYAAEPIGGGLVSSPACSVDHCAQSAHHDSDVRCATDNQSSASGGLSAADRYHDFGPGGLTIPAICPPLLRTNRVFQRPPTRRPGSISSPRSAGRHARRIPVRRRRRRAGGRGRTRIRCYGDGPVGVQDSVVPGAGVVVGAGHDRARCGLFGVRAELK